MKCSDIPDGLIVQAIRELREPMPNGSSAMPWHWVLCRELSETLSKKMGVEIPSNLYWAKMRQVIRKGTIAGCPCGCRGDYEITSKTKAYVEEVDGLAAARRAFARQSRR